MIKLLKKYKQKELIELFVNDEKLIKKLPKNQYFVEFNFGNSNKDYFTDTLNYRIYKKLLKD